MSEPKSQRVLVKRPPHEAGFDPEAWREELQLQARLTVDRILEKRWLKPWQRVEPILRDGQGTVRFLSTEPGRPLMTMEWPKGAGK